MPKKKKLGKGKKPTNAHQKEKYKQHYLKVYKNKRRKLQKHLSLQLKDIQALAALKRNMGN